MGTPQRVVPHTSDDFIIYLEEKVEPCEAGLVTKSRTGSSAEPSGRIYFPGNISFGHLRPYLPDTADHEFPAGFFSSSVNTRGLAHAHA